MRNLISVRNVMLALALVLGFASTATAAPRIWSYLWDGASGNTYEDCAGRLIAAKGYATDTAGNIKCSATQLKTGSWQVTNGNCTGATRHKAQMTGQFIVFCSSAPVSWTTQTNCGYTQPLRKNEAGACTSRTLYAYSQGTTN